MTIVHSNTLLQDILEITGEATNSMHYNCPFTKSTGDFVNVYCGGDKYQLIGMAVINGHAVFYGATSDPTKDKFFSTTLHGTTVPTKEEYCSTVFDRKCFEVQIIGIAHEFVGKVLTN